MKRTLIIGALALSTSLAFPAFAQQAPTNAPNPSAPPTEGSPTGRLNAPPSGGMAAGTGTTYSSPQMSSDSKKEPMNKRSSKPRQKDAAPAVTPDSPSGPKGDSPSPAPRN